MRIEPSQAPVPPAQPAGAVGIPQPSYNSVLISPEAPTWPHAIAQFFQRLWDWVISLFGKKAAPPPKEEFRLAPDVAQVVRQHRAQQKPNRLQSIAKNAVATYALSWYMGSYQPLAILAFSTSTGAVAYCAKYFFPSASPQVDKISNLISAIPTAWVISNVLGNFLGYPKQIFALLTAMQITQSLFQAQMIAQQQKFQRVQARMAQS